MSRRYGVPPRPGPRPGGLRPALPPPTEGLTWRRSPERARRRKEFHMADSNERILEALLQEKRQFAPPKEFARKAHVSSPSVYRKADRDFEKFWAGFAKELDWYRPWKKVLDWKPPHGEVVRRRQAERRRVNCLDRHLAGAAPQQGRAHLGGRAGRPADADLPRPLPRGRQVRATCCKKLGVEEGRPRHDLPADDPGAADRDARVRADRRDPLGRLRRLLGRVAARPHQRPAAQAARHRRRRLAARQRRAAQADRRRGARRGTPIDRERRRRAAHRHGRSVVDGRAATTGGTG